MGPGFLLFFELFLPFVAEHSIHQLLDFRFLAVQNPQGIVFLILGGGAIKPYQLLLRGIQLQPAGGGLCRCFLSFLPIQQGGLCNAGGFGNGFQCGLGQVQLSTFGLADFSGGQTDCLCQLLLGHFGPGSGPANQFSCFLSHRHP